MKKIRKTLAGIIALSMFASNAVYISAAEEVKNDAGSQTVSEDAAGSSAEVKYTKELAEVMAKADNSEKIPVYISLADIDPSVLDAKIREKFNGKYGTLDEYYNYEEVILPRIIEEAEKEFGEALAHARVFKDEETGEIIARGFDTYVKDGSELLKLMNSMSYEERNAYIHSGFSEEDLKKAYESSEKGYSIVTARMSHDIDDYRMVVVNSKIELQHKNVSDCLTKYISEDEILSNAVNNCMAMLTKDQIEEISRDSQVTSIMYAPPVPADSSGALIVEEDEIKPGDIYSDGRIDLSDLTILSLFLIGDTDLEDSQKKAADVDGDGAVTLADLARLQQYLSKKITAF
ncbi:MAG: dockerin type I repeat-containing protein [Oscillospiraceae bacterium]|nr:dockerin type I repeat-containing protein [Oscillospiraceae bacterium]